MEPTITMEVNGIEGVYSFVRDYRGEGQWLRKSTSSIACSNTFVHSILGRELTLLAREKNVMETYNFSRMIPKPKPTPKPLRAKKVKSNTKVQAKVKAGRIIGGFNPFTL